MTSFSIYIAAVMKLNRDAASSVYNGWYCKKSKTLSVILTGWLYSLFFNMKKMRTYRAKMLNMSFKQQLSTQLHEE